MNKDELEQYFKEKENKYIYIGDHDFIVGSTLNDGLLELGLTEMSGCYVGSINKDDAIKLIEHIKLLFGIGES